MTCFIRRHKKHESPREEGFGVYRESDDDLLSHG